MIYIHSIVCESSFICRCLGFSLPGREEGRKGGGEEGRKGGREGGRDGGMEGGREGGARAMPGNQLVEYMIQVTRHIF